MYNTEDQIRNAALPAIAERLGVDLPMARNYMHQQGCGFFPVGNGFLSMPITNGQWMNINLVIPPSYQDWKDSDKPVRGLTPGQAGKFAAHVGARLPSLEDIRGLKLACQNPFWLSDERSCNAMSWKESGQGVYGREGFAYVPFSYSWEKYLGTELRLWVSEKEMFVQFSRLNMNRPL